MSVQSITTTRRRGHLREPKALARFLRKQGWPRSIATAQQVHRAKIAVVPALLNAHNYVGADGLLTAMANQPLGIFTADCVPVFLSARAGTVVGLLHAGWRGVQAEIVPRAIRMVQKRWAILPSEIQVWAGPSIGACCFEVQWDVARFFPLERQRAKDRWTVDLGSALKRQVVRSGARWVKTTPTCTMHSGRYFSFRRDATPHRQVSLIMKKDGHEKKS